MSDQPITLKTERWRTVFIVVELTVPLHVTDHEVAIILFEILVDSEAVNGDARIISVDDTYPLPDD